MVVVGVVRFGFGRRRRRGLVVMLVAVVELLVIRRRVGVMDAARRVGACGRRIVRGAGGFMGESEVGGGVRMAW